MDLIDPTGDFCRGEARAWLGSSPGRVGQAADTGGYFGIFLSNIFNAPLLLFDEMCHKDWIFIIQFVHA